MLYTTSTEIIMMPLFFQAGFLSSSGLSSSCVKYDPGGSDRKDRSREANVPDGSKN